MDTPSPVVVQRLLREMEGYSELDLQDEVLRRANQLLHANSAFSPALLYKARALQALERWTEAIAVFERLLAQEPEEDAAYLGLGWCHKRTGRLDLALMALEGLVNLRPDDALATYNLACYRALDGEAERALDLLRRALELDGAFRAFARDEEDFDSIRSDPRFRALVDGPSEEPA